MEPNWRLAATDLDYTYYYLDEASVTFDSDTVTFILKVDSPPGSKTYRATRSLLESYGKGPRPPRFTLQRWLIDEARNVVRLLHLTAYDADGKFIASLNSSNPADTFIDPMSVEEKIRTWVYALNQPTRSESISQAVPKPPNYQQGHKVSGKEPNFTGEEKASSSGKPVLYIALALGFVILIANSSNIS